MKETLRHMRSYLNTQHPTRLPLFSGIPSFKDLNHMQNNRDRSDFADAHTDLSTDAMMPLKYLIMKKLSPRVSVHIQTCRKH